MNLKVTFIIIILLFLIIHPIDSKTLHLKPESVSYDVTVFKESNLTAGFKIKIVYNWTVIIESQSKQISKNEEQKITIKNIGGKASMSIFIPFGGIWFDAGSFDYDISSSKTFNFTIPILNNATLPLSLKISNQVFSNIETKGPVLINTNNLVWENSKPKEITIKPNEQAKGGEKVLLNLTFYVKFILDAVINIGIIPITLTSFELGISQAKPNIIYELEIVESYLFNFDWFIIVGIIIIIAISLVLISRRYIKRKRSK